MPAISAKLDAMVADLEAAEDSDFSDGAARSAMIARLRMVKEMATAGDYSSAWQQTMEGVVGASAAGKGGFAGPIANRELQRKLFWSGSEVATFLKMAGS